MSRIFLKTDTFVLTHPDRTTAPVIDGQASAAPDVNRHLSSSIAERGGGFAPR